MPQDVSILEITDAPRHNDCAVVDVRPMAAYNGWALRGEFRGGHIPGARPAPLSWLKTMEDADLLELLEAKGISRQKEIIVYGYDSTEGETASRKLSGLGYSSLRVFMEGQPAWAADAARSMERLPRYRQLIHADWLKELIDNGQAPEFNGNPCVLAHVSFDNKEDYDIGHIPGSIFLNTLFLEEPEHWNRRNPRELERALLDNGITSETLVVLYGRYGTPSMENEQPGRYAGQIAAMRAALLLMYAGVQDVRVLDGGLGAWTSAGYRVTSQSSEPTPADRFGRPIPGRPDYTIDIDQAKEYLADPMAELVSMRSWPEFIGEKSGYHYIGPRGRIPGAVFGNCGSDAYHMENYRNHDNTMLCYHEIAANWKDMGVIPEKRIAFYCGTGWRASEAFFYAHLMGWDQIAIYDGGWYEWSVDARNPTETGIPEDSIISGRLY